MKKTIIFIFFTFLLLNLSAQEQKIQKLNKVLAPNAPASNFVKFKGLNRTLIDISNQYDNSGVEFGVIDFKAATDDPSEPDSVKHRLWKDPDLDLVYGGNFVANGDITANKIRIKTGAGPNKVLTSLGTSGLASWQTLASGNSINGLTDGKAESNTGSVYLGDGAGTNDDSPGISDPSNNTGLGINALNKNGLVASQRGEKNTAIGFEALKNLDNNNGNNNTSIGYQTLVNNTSGYENTTLGTQTMLNYSSGFGNTAIGYQSLFGGSLGKVGKYNIALGYNALSDLETTSSSSGEGSYNVVIGYKAGMGHTNIKDELIIQNNKNTGGQAEDPLIWGDFNFEKVQIFTRGASVTSKFYVDNSAGGTSSWTNHSDKRLKKDISTIPNSLNKVLKLRGVNFNWIDTEKHREGLQMGFIAQEALEVIPEVVDDAAEYMSMQYAPITALLVEAVKEQQKIIDEMKKQNSDLVNVNSDLEKRLSNIESLVKTNKFTKASN